MARIKVLVPLLLVLVFLSGCEALYYDMVLDRSEMSGADKGDSLGKGSDVGHVSKYH